MLGNLTATLRKLTALSVARFWRNASGNVVGFKSGAGIISPIGDLARRAQHGRSRPVAMGLGNSIMLRNIPSYSTTNQIVSYGNVQWALALLGQPFKWARTGAKTAVDSGFLSYGIFAYSGATSVVLEPYVATHIVPYAPDVCFCQVMENDVVRIVDATITRAQAKAAYLSIVKQLLHAGITPIWIQCYPSKSYTDALYAAEFWALTHYMEELAQQYPQMIMVDSAYNFQDSSLDGVQPFSSGNFVNYWDSSVHPQQVAVYLGKQIADVLTNYGFGEFSPLPGGGDARSIHLNPYMSGSGGTPGTGWGVTCSESWGITASTLAGSPALTTDVVDVDGTHEALELTVTAAGPETGIENLADVVNDPSVSSGFTADDGTGTTGDYVQAFCDVEYDSSVPVTGLQRTQLSVTFNGGSNNPSVMVHTDDWAMPIIYDRKIRLATHEMRVPSGTSSIVTHCYFKGMSGLPAGAALKARVRYLNLVNWSKDET